MCSENAELAQSTPFGHSGNSHECGHRIAAHVGSRALIERFDFLVEVVVPKHQLDSFVTCVLLD
jgi:hypothetical protein